MKHLFYSLRIGLISAIITSIIFVADAKINIATGLKSEIIPPTSAPNGIARRVSTRENPRTLPCILVGTVSWWTDATMVFQAILQGHSNTKCNCTYT